MPVIDRCEVVSAALRPHHSVTAEAISAQTEVVMWDVLSADFDVKKTPEDCFEQLLVNTRPGAIVVFHDSERAAPRMLPILEPYLRWLKDEGYTCKLLPSRG